MCNSEVNQHLSGRMSYTQLHCETYFTSLCSNQKDKFPEVHLFIGQICDRIPKGFLADQAVIDYGCI